MNWKKNSNWLISFFTICIIFLCISCSVSYSLKDVTIPPEVKTIKISYIENKASYINPQLSALLTDKLQLKIANQTKLTRTNADDAHYQIKGYISDYSVSTSAIGTTSAATNRLNVVVHILFTNTLDNKSKEFDVNRNFDFDASLSLQQAETRLMDEILKNTTDEIFNQIFSTW